MINNPYLSTSISTVREGIINTVVSDKDTFEEKILDGLKASRNELIVGVITYGTVGNSHFLGLLEKTFEKNPRGVFDSLIKLNIKPSVIQSIVSQFTSKALKGVVNEFFEDEKDEEE